MCKRQRGHSRNVGKATVTSTGCTNKGILHLKVYKTNLMSHRQNFILEEHFLGNQDQISDQIKGRPLRESLKRATSIVSCHGKIKDLVLVSYEKFKKKVLHL